MSKLGRDPFFRQTITGDENCIPYINPDRKKQCLTPEQPALLAPKPSLHHKIVLPSVWSDFTGIIHCEILNPNDTISAKYCAQFDRINMALIQRHSGLINPKDVILHHDNARPHSAKISQEKVKELRWGILPQTPYSVPSDYHIFKSMEYFLRGKNFMLGQLSKLY